MNAPIAYRCSRCGAWATRHFRAPYGIPSKGTLHACGAHADAAEAKWREIYNIKRAA